MSPSVYTSSSSMEPLLPDLRRPELAELSREVFKRSGELTVQLPAEACRRRVAHLVREMNSYYSNLIEGHKTLPRDIERALRNDYAGSEETRTNQHLARAHIETEQAMMQRLMAEPETSVVSPSFISWLHQQFYERLPEALHFSESLGGKAYRVIPGACRDFEVRVHRHQPPAAASLEAFLARYAKAYASRDILATNQLTALAAAHHRLAWIHPFGDGNGRVGRLQSQAWLLRCGVHAGGLWSLSRGLARQRADYYNRLADADQERKGDTDGRGNLSERGLAAFCEFMLRTMLDQVQFMSSLLELQTLAARVEQHLQFQRLHLASRERERLARLLKAALVEGEIERGRVHEIVGAGISTGQKVIRLALAEGLMDAPSPKGRLSLTFTSDTLESYFPRLYQDLG